MAASSAASRNARNIWSRSPRRRSHPVPASNPKDGFRRYVKKDPLGVVMVIAPWNYPYLTAVNTIVPALMAGSTVILKHAAQTLLVGERFAQAFEKAGLPKGVFQNIVLNHAQTEKLLGSRQDRPRQFHRLGRRRTRHREGGGRHLHDARAGTRRQGPGLCAARRQDGPSPSPISSTAPSSIPASAAAASSASTSTRRSMTSSSKASSPRRRTMSLGNPLEQATTMGPMAQARFADLIREQKAEALRKGADAHMNMKDGSDGAGSPYLRARGADRCRPPDVSHARGELRADRRHHEGARTTRRRSR